MKDYILIIISVVIYNSSFAQTQHRKLENKNRIIVHNLKVGEKVPRIFIRKIINNQFKSGYIQDFKEKLIILDFWAVGCASCVEKLPKLDSLQISFARRIKILPVTFDSEETVSTFFKSNKYGRRVRLPSVVEDKNLTMWFKHLAISHMVWIYKEKVVAITDASYVTKSNIELILNGGTQNWPVKDDGTIIDPTKPFILKNKVSNLNKYVIISSFKAGNINGLDRIGTIRDSIRQIRRNYIFNMDLLASYKYIWYKLGINLENVYLEVKDKSKYIYNPKKNLLADWQSEHAFCYESEFPENGLNYEQQLLVIKADLDRFFGVITKFENRSTNCLILTKKDNVYDNIKTKGGDFSIYKDGNQLKFRNCAISDILPYLNEGTEDRVIIDETNYKERVDLDLDITSPGDISAVNHSFEKYGLNINIEKRILKTFCIKEIN